MGLGHQKVGTGEQEGARGSAGGRGGEGEGGKAKWPGVGQRLSRSLSSRCLRDRHQTHSPWGQARSRVSSPRLPGKPEG